jgi:hypothetical protein
VVPFSSSINGAALTGIPLLSSKHPSTSTPTRNVSSYRSESLRTLSFNFCACFGIEKLLLESESRFNYYITRVVAKKSYYLWLINPSCHFCSYDKGVI